MINEMLGTYVIIFHGIGNNAIIQSSYNNNFWFVWIWERLSIHFLIEKIFYSKAHDQQSCGDAFSRYDLLYEHLIATLFEKS